MTLMMKYINTISLQSLTDLTVLVQPQCSMCISEVSEPRHNLIFQQSGIPSIECPSLGSGPDGPDKAVC